MGQAPGRQHILMSWEGERAGDAGSWAPFLLPGAWNVHCARSPATSLGRPRFPTREPQSAFLGRARASAGQGPLPRVCPLVQSCQRPARPASRVAEAAGRGGVVLPAAMGWLLALMCSLESTKSPWSDLVSFPGSLLDPVYQQVLNNSNYLTLGWAAGLGRGGGRGHTGVYIWSRTPGAGWLNGCLLLYVNYTAIRPISKPFLGGMG